MVITMKHSERHCKDYMIGTGYLSIPSYQMQENLISPDKQIEIGKKEKNNGILNEVFKDKFETVKSTLFDIVSELNNRLALDHQLTRKINEDICRLRTQLFELESWPTGGNHAMDKRRGALEDKIHKLENELRIQDIRRWQDMVFLKKELRKTFMEYNDLKRKLKIIEYGIKR